MKLVNQGHSIYRYDFNLDPITNIYNQIEYAGRTCYKSTRPEGQTAKNFVDKMIASKHYAMLEHGTVYLYGTYDVSAIGSWNHSIGRKYSENKYSIVHTDGKMDLQGIYVTTNLRVIKENGWEDDLKYICQPTLFHKERVMIRFICSRAIAQELTRHRVFSFAMESQRYCNYSKNKFSNEVKYVIPSFFTHNLGGESYTNHLEVISKTPKDNYSKEEFSFINSCIQNEKDYFNLLETLPPEHARSVLNNSCKTELVMTGFVEDWKHLFELRSSKATTGKPHPDMVNLIDNLIHSNFYNETF